MSSNDHSVVWVEGDDKQHASGAAIVRAT